jgi:hypothetical protein
MDVWNLSRDTELPAMRQRVSDTTALRFPIYDH